ncbi:TonB-dependent receptor [Novosphingobium umbonatum]|uniref:TonB-dependent receptor n=1 Tax=Novosphingobium umbonatum TaxID=1908524 RepID=A0A437N3L2_9SPHN|nr:TonB-dependent receptor [Novosphingobium umbonatum]RVU04497.1 TonB-dependent receptor [Novosphingobium umbonatum]
MTSHSGIWRRSASVLALGTTMLSAAASAQTAAPANNAPSDPAIIVSGIRQSLANALNTKRNSDQVIDAISAEDVGKFPDKNIGEALQRITGVQISRAGGEGSSVSIRGVDPGLIRVEVNGQSQLSTFAADVAGAATNPAVEFRDIPAEFISRLEVVKSATADMTEGGLGGTVRIVTRRPFDSKAGYLAGSVQGVYGTLGNRLDPKVALIGSRLFANDTLGIQLSATYEKRSLWYDQAKTTGWRNVRKVGAAAATCSQTVQTGCTDLNGDGSGDFYPDIPRYAMYRESTERYALNNIIEWRPSDKFKLNLDTTYTRGLQTLNSQLMQMTTFGAQTTALTLDPSTVINAGNAADYVKFVAPATTNPTSTSGLGVTYRNILGTIDRQSFTGQLGAQWQATDRLTLKARGGYSWARAYNDEIDTVANQYGLTYISVDYRNASGAPQIGMSADPTSPTGINNFQIQHKPRLNLQTEKNLQFDGEYKLDGFVKSIKFGVQRRITKLNSIYHDATVTYNGYTSTAGVGSITNRTWVTGSAVDAVSSTGTNAAILSQIQSIVSHYDLGDHNFFNTGNLGFNGYSRWMNMGMAVANAAGIPDATGASSWSPGATYDVRQKNLAGYVSAKLGFDLFGRNLDLVIGARGINFKTLSTGYKINTVAGTFAPVAYTGNSTYVLPSANLRYALVDNKLILRATATKVAAAPDLSKITPSLSLNSTALTGSRGNPDLRPYTAQQYDLGLEWYVSKLNYLSATLWRKDINGFPYRLATSEDFNGQTYVITTYKNSPAPVQINGLELGSQFAFSFLPGPLKHTGASANYTYAKDSGFSTVGYYSGVALGFPGLSRHSFNTSVYYEDDRLSARVSYNWRSRYNIGLERDNLNAFGHAYGQWDASASVKIGSHLTAFVDLVNITNAQRTEDEESTYRVSTVETFGRRVYFGLRGKL